MPKGLYFTAAVFSFFLLPFSDGGHWTDVNQTWTHIHLWLLFEKFGTNSPGHLPLTGSGKNPAFWDRLWTLTEHMSAMEHNINNRKEICQSTGTLLHVPNLVNFGQETAENGWRVFTPLPPKFSPALPHGRYNNRQQAIFGTCYVVARAYSLEQQNAGWAHAYFAMHLVVFVVHINIYELF